MRDFIVIVAAALIAAAIWLLSLIWRLAAMPMNWFGATSTTVLRPGTGKDGGPNCATVQLIGDWEIIKGDDD